MSELKRDCREHFNCFTKAFSNILIDCSTQVLQRDQKRLGMIAKHGNKLMTCNYVIAINEMNMKKIVSFEN